MFFSTGSEVPPLELSTRKQDGDQSEQYDIMCVYMCEHVCEYMCELECVCACIGICL